jgi:hypothetical protein
MGTVGRPVAEIWCWGRPQNRRRYAGKGLARVVIRVSQSEVSWIARLMRDTCKAYMGARWIVRDVSMGQCVVSKGHGMTIKYPSGYCRYFQ